jgi:hypothetical protein
MNCISLVGFNHTLYNGIDVVCGDGDIFECPNPVFVCKYCREE